MRCLRLEALLQRCILRLAVHLESLTYPCLLLLLPQVEGGDCIRILTPGGGGFGPPTADAACAAAAAGDGDALAAAAEGQVAAAKRRRSGGSEFSAPLRDGGSVQRYTRDQETV